LQEAKEALERKRHERREHLLPALGRKPLLLLLCQCNRCAEALPSCAAIDDRG
jgi:hypothetical protein